MALRDLIIGGGSCAVPGTLSATNPLGGLAESIFGSASKTQVLYRLIMMNIVFFWLYILHEMDSSLRTICMHDVGSLLFIGCIA